MQQSLRVLVNSKVALIGKELELAKFIHQRHYYWLPVNFGRKGCGGFLRLTN